LTLVAVTWGLTYPVTSTLLTHLPVQILLGLRFGLAAVILLPFMLRARLSWPMLAGAALLGVVEYLEFTSLAAGLAQTPPGRAAFLVSMSVVLISVADAVGGRGRLNARTLGAVLLTVIGLVLVTLNGTTFRALIYGVQFSLGEFLCVACAVFTAAQVVLTGTLSRRNFSGRRIPLLALVGVQFMVVAILSLGWGTATHGWDRVTLTGTAFWPVVGGTVFLALLATVLALVSQTWAQRRVSASRVALIYSLEPLVAAAVSAGLLGERFAAPQLAGAALILVAVLFSEWPFPGRAVPGPPARGSALPEEQDDWQPQAWEPERIVLPSELLRGND